MSENSTIAEFASVMQARFMDLPVVDNRTSKTEGGRIMRTYKESSNRFLGELVKLE